MGIIRWVIKKVIVIIVILSVVIFFFQNQAVKLAVNLAVMSKTNARIKISKVDSKLQKGYIRFSGVTLLNPKGFKEPRLAEINSLLLKVDLLSLIKQEIRVEKLFIDVNRIYIVKQKGKRTNFVSVRKPHPIRRYEETRVKKTHKILIQDLKIKILDVFYKDFSSNPPVMRRLHLGLRQEYSNITDFRKLFDALLTQDILKVVISNSH